MTNSDRRGATHWAPVGTSPRAEPARRYGYPVTLVQSPFALRVYGALVLVIGLSFWLKSRQQRLESVEDQRLESVDS